MRLLVSALILFFASCTHSVPPVVVKKDSIVYVHDTVIVKRNATMPDTVFITVDIPCNHKKQMDSLKTALLVQKYKVARVRYYVKICLRNPSQDKFLKGWVLRAID